MTSQQILNLAFQNLIADITQAHKAAGQYVTGRTISTLRYETTETGGRLFGAAYIGVLDKGRRDGKIPYGMQTIIMQWAAAKGLTFKSEADARRFAFFVARRIAREGTKLYRQGGRTDVLQEPVQAFTDTLKKQLAGLYTQEIKNHIFEAPNKTNTL